MDLGYNATSSKFRTRIFCPQISAADIALSTRAANATLQSQFTDRLVVRGDTGLIEMGKTSITEISTSFATGVLNVVNTNPTSANIVSLMNPNLLSLSTTTLTLGKIAQTNQAVEFSYTDNMTTSLRSSSWGFYGAVTSNITIQPSQITLNTNTTVNGTSTSLGTGILKVNNTSTDIQSHLAQFLQPTLGGIGVATEDTNITFGKSNTTDNAAQLQFGYSSGGLVPFDNPFITLGFYGLSGTRIQLRTNPNLANAQKNVQIFGNTEIVGNFTVTGTVSVKNSSVFYQTFTNFSIPNATFTDVPNLLPVFENGTNRLTPTATGFQNNTGLILQVSISFSCVRTDPNPVGSNTIRISYGLFSEYLAEAISQEFQPVSVSANFPLQPTQKLRCIIYPDALFSPVQYGQVRITINTTPIV
jgi:hypothetical protein